MQEPGHSSLGSGADVVGAGVVVVVVGGGGLFGGSLVTGALVLSQQTDPRLQLAVFGIKIEGRSQNAAIIFNRQKPGHLGNGGGVVGLGVVVVTSYFSFDPPAGVPVMQQVPSPGQKASESTSSQNNAKNPNTQSPSQAFPPVVEVTFVFGFEVVFEGFVGLVLDLIGS